MALAWRVDVAPLCSVRCLRRQAAGSGWSVRRASPPVSGRRAAARRQPGRSSPSPAAFWHTGACSGSARRPRTSRPGRRSGSLIWRVPRSAGSESPLVRDLTWWAGTIAATLGRLAAPCARFCLFSACFCLSSCLCLRSACFCLRSARFHLFFLHATAYFLRASAYFPRSVF